MRFGCCINMIAAGPDKIGAEHAGLLAGAGYDYLEMPLAEMTALSEERFKAVAAGVEASGLRCEACNNLFPSALRLTGTQVDEAAVREYLKRAFETAARLGAQVVVFGSGGAKRLPDGFDRQKGYAQVVQATRLACAAAAQYGITVAIEPLRRQECNIINTFSEGVGLARDAGSQNCRVLVDFYHLTSENEPVADVEKDGRRYLAHVHFACPALGTPNERSYPSSPEEWDYASFAAALRHVGYDGRVSVEAYCRTDLKKQAALSLQTVRQIFRAGGKE